MRLRSPSSRGFFRARLSAVDFVWALLSPLFALYLSGAQILWSSNEVGPVVVYCFISLLFSLIAFFGFRLRDGLTQYFSVNDALEVLKAVVVSELMTGAALFTLTRLEGVPRSAPIIHALVLTAGLVFSRLLVRMTHAENRAMRRSDHAIVERILMIGATRLSAQYIQLLDAYSSRRRQVVALLDERTERIGRSISGVRVVALAHEIQPMIEEYAVHGIRIDRIIVGGDVNLLSEEALHEIRCVCDNRGISLDFVPDLIGLRDLNVAEPRLALPEDQAQTPFASMSGYFRFKRAIDCVMALALMIFLSPFFVLVSGLALLDVGSPIFFWQQRLGRGGRTFLLYKVRTLRTPFDWRGQPVPEEDRLSWIGKVLRGARLDEFPQLLNVLVGDMSLSGPRPLLPADQPENPAMRLMIRPGITGWAQVNGGASLMPDEKNDLDEWYVRNASLWLDLRILFKTVRFLFTSERNSECALAAARDGKLAARGASDLGVEKSSATNAALPSHDKIANIESKILSAGTETQTQSITGGLVPETSNLPPDAARLQAGGKH